jgi:hypothetical protein
MGHPGTSKIPVLLADRRFPARIPALSEPFPLSPLQFFNGTHAFAEISREKRGHRFFTSTRHRTKVMRDFGMQ